MLSLLLFISSSQLSTPSFAAVASSGIKTYKTDTTSVKTWVPKNFDALVGYLSNPLALVSNKGTQGLRTVIEIAPYNREDKEDFLSKVKMDPQVYYEQKEKWLSGYEGQSISYSPLKEDSKNGSRIYSVGMKYKNDFGEFFDQTFYISSKTKHLFYVKAVIPLDMEEEQIVNVDRVVQTLAEQN